MLCFYSLSKWVMKSQGTGENCGVGRYEVTEGAMAGHGMERVGFRG